MGIGAGFTSSQGISDVYKQIADMHPASIAKHIGESLDMHVFRKLIDINFGPQEDYPRFSASNVPGMTASQILPPIISAMQSGGLTKTYDTESWIRKTSHMPPISRGEYEGQNTAPRGARRDRLRALLDPDAPAKSAESQAMNPKREVS